MELAQISPFCFSDVGHKVSYDSWEKFIDWGNNLEKMWRDFKLILWSCREAGGDKEKDNFILQLIYVSPSRSIRKNSLEDSSYSVKYLDQKTVEVKFKSSEVSIVKEWLIRNNPDPWKIKKLEMT